MTWNFSNKHGLFCLNGGSVSKISYLRWVGHSTNLPHCGYPGSSLTADPLKLRRGQLLLLKMQAAQCAGAPVSAALPACALVYVLLLSKTNFRRRGARCLASKDFRLKPRLIALLSISFRLLSSPVCAMKFHATCCKPFFKLHSVTLTLFHC